jgi:multidrug efflux pump subunit AcrA (membrane-fusion protein)
MKTGWSKGMGVLGLALLVGLAGCKRGETIEKPAGGEARAQESIGATIFGTGVLAHDRSLVVAFERAGVIQGLTVDVGDTVAEGQVLATLDDADAKTELARERANRRSEQATLGRLRSDEDQVKLREEIARREAGRSELLQKAGAIPEIENDRSQDAPRLVALDRRGVELQRGVILAKLAQAEAREAQASLWQRKTVLRASSAGRVVRRDATAGSYTAPGAPVLVIAPSGSEVASLWVHESELPQVRAGASVQLTLRDRERTRLQGRVRRVHLEADQRTHEVRVDVELAQLPAALVFGVRVDGQIERPGGGKP